MRISVVGPGRAGLGLALAAARAGHQIVAVASRNANDARAAAERLGSAPLRIGDEFPPTDLLVIAVTDDAIEGVAAAVARACAGVVGAVHLSGRVSVRALAPLANTVGELGSFHPLQTMPTADAGAARLAGAWIAITAEPPLSQALFALARSLDATPFRLADHHKAVYHAGAAAAANFTLGALVMADDLLSAAGVPFEAARPLVEAVVANAFELGARASLTGPVARGDVGTVAAQMAAVRDEVPEWSVEFGQLVMLLARISGRTEEFAHTSEGNGSRR